MKLSINTFEEACSALNYSTELPNVSLLPEKHQKAITAHYKLIIIIEALNEGWTPNWDDHNEKKYYPWFYMGGSGSPFSYFGYVCAYSGSNVGSRFCLKSSELAKTSTEVFPELYADLFLIK